MIKLVKKNFSNLLTKIIIIRVIISITIFLVFVYAYWTTSNVIPPSYPYLEFTQDKNFKTLTVNETDLVGESWEGIVIHSGNATLPTGTIDIGDTITNCSGNLMLIFDPANTIIGEWDFT